MTTTYRQSGNRAVDNGIWLVSLFTSGRVAVRAGTCTPGSRPRACQWRHDAIRAGDFCWDELLRGWRFTQEADIVRHRMSARTRWFFEARFRALEGQPFTYPDCPGCGEPLPDLAADNPVLALPAKAMGAPVAEPEPDPTPKPEKTDDEVG